MKRILMFLCALLLATAVYADATREVTLSGSYNDTERVGTTALVAGDALAPLGKFGLLGPQVAFTYVAPDHGRSVTGTGFGALYEFNFGSSKVTPFLGADGLYWTGDFGNAFNGQVGLRGGAKFRSGNAYLKVFLSKTRQFADRGQDVDSTAILAGFGLRL